MPDPSIHIGLLRLTGAREREREGERERDTEREREYKDMKQLYESCIIIFLWVHVCKNGNNQTVSCFLQSNTYAHTQTHINTNTHTQASVSNFAIIRPLN